MGTKTKHRATLSVWEADKHSAEPGSLHGRLEFVDEAGLPVAAVELGPSQLKELVPVFAKLREAARRKVSRA